MNLKIVFVIGLVQIVLGQNGIKTIGIKTGSLVYNATGWPPNHFQDITTSPQYVAGGHNSSRDIFLNRTITNMPTGICFKEVPTISLLKDTSFIPAGNGSNPSLSKIQVCCDGYSRNIHNFRKCDPICTEECVNGLCVAPERCQCFPDHVINMAGTCIPTCPIGCGNGTCAADGSCVCNPGYQHEINRKFCIPTCAQGCFNGVCTAPDTCTCNTGYKLNNDNKCEAVCTGGCAFGQCIAPEQCSCLAGYEKVGGTCKPICTRGCSSGECIAPEVCSCGIGWIIDSVGTTCKPNCDRPCLNGRCTAPNTCSCFTGYIVDDTNPFRCIAHCPSGCPNGVCSGPNFCLCKVGFVKDRSLKGSQACVAASVH